MPRSGVSSRGTKRTQAESPAAPAPAPPARRPVVLLVEDDVRVCDLVVRLLERAGLTVRTAVDAPAALACLAEGVDLVLLDVLLPRGDGFELCRLVRTYEGDDYLPIIMLTALGDEGHRHAGFLAGADDYITKPFSNLDLLDRVQVWLRARERMAALKDRLLREQEQRLQGAHERRGARAPRRRRPLAS